MQTFVYQALPSRVLFGAGTLDRLAEEVDRLGVRRVLVLSTRRRADADRLLALLGDRVAGIFSRSHDAHAGGGYRRRAAEVAAPASTAPWRSAAARPRAWARRSPCAPTCRRSCVPTTYAGSEMTPILGETRDGLKTTAARREDPAGDGDLRRRPDPDACRSACRRPRASTPSPMRWRRSTRVDANPIISLMAEEGIRALARALPSIMTAPRDEDARSDALYGAWLCGACLGAVGMALHHKLCHTIGGTFDLPHAETHTVVLPHAIAYNAASAPQAMARIARALGAGDAAQGVLRSCRPARRPARTA